MCATRTKSDLPQYFYIPANATTMNYYVCLTPPKALHHVVGKQKYRQSTGTAGRGDAGSGAILRATHPLFCNRLLRRASPCGLGLGRKRLRAGRPGPALHALRQAAAPRLP